MGADQQGVGAANMGGAVAGHQLEEGEDKEELPGNEPTVGGDGPIFCRDVESVGAMGQGRRKRWQHEQRPVKVLIAEALKRKGEHDSTDDGERVVQRHAGRTEAAVDFAPQQNEKRRADAAGQGCWRNKGVGGCGQCQSRHVRGHGEPKQKSDGPIDPASPGQRRDAAGEQGDDDSAAGEHHIVGELAGGAADGHGHRGIRIGERHPGAPQGKAEKGERHIEKIGE